MRAFRALDDLLVAAPSDRHPERFALHVLRKDVRSLRSMLSRLADAGVSPKEIDVFIDHLDSEMDPSNFSYELAQYASDMMPDDWLGYDVSAAFTGGHLRRRLMRYESELLRKFLAPGTLGLKAIVAGTAWLALRLPTIWLNIWSERSANPCPDYCSSAILRLRVRQERSGVYVISPGRLGTDLPLGTDNVDHRAIGGNA